MPNLLKSAWRDQLLEKRKQLPEKEREEKSRQICRRIANLPFFRQAQVIAFYYPVHNEVNLLPLLRGITLFPKIIKNELHFYRAAFSELVPGTFSIPEPPENLLLSAQPQIPDLLLVPGVAFDWQGYRLGYGKGYYDRFLQRLQYQKLQYPRPQSQRNSGNADRGSTRKGYGSPSSSLSSSIPAIGIAYEFQIVPSLPHDEHDVPLDYLITEKRVITCR